MRQLQQAIVQVAAKDSESQMLQSVGTLLLVLSNTAQHPAESKYRTLKLENAKIKAMLAGGSEIISLLKAAGTPFSTIVGCSKEEQAAGDDDHPTLSVTKHDHVRQV